MNKLSLILLSVLMVPQSSIAEVKGEQAITLACYGWAIDRFTISTLLEKHGQMLDALNGIDGPNALQLKDFITQLDQATLESVQSSKTVYEQLCGSGE